jgi:hypothetical protein
MKSKWLKILLLVLLCFAAFCIIAVFTRIYTLGDLQINFFGALLGTVITALVTVLLLSGQSSAEEVKERNVAVFNDKSAIFKNYIGILWQTWDDHYVSKEEYALLTSTFYKELMLYLNDESQRIIGEALLQIADCREIETDENPEVEQKLRDSIESIINMLIKELSLGGKINHELFVKVDQKLETQRTRSTRTTFKLLKIKPGTELVFKGDDSKRCKTVDDNNTVEYNGKQYSISALSSELLNGVPSSGYVNFMFDGKTLAAIRKEREGK